jgi:hypothetical protein
VKFALATTARKVAVRDRQAVGSGLVDALAARGARNGNGNAGVDGRSDGSGSIDDSRGEVVVTGPCSPEDYMAAPHPTECKTTGDETALGRPFDADSYTEPWTGSSWYTSQWATATVRGSSWYTSTWVNGSSWYGSSWYGSSWYGSFESGTFYGATLAGSSWYGAWG